MNAPSAIEEFAYGTLVAFEALQLLVGDRVYMGVAPSTAVYPYILLIPRGGTKVQPLGMTEWSQASVPYIVKAVSREGETYSLADSVAGAIFKALKDSHGEVTVDEREYYVAVSRMDEDIRYNVLENGERSNHVGGVYLFVVDPGEEI
jgi:hypothetical protein